MFNDAPHPAIFAFGMGLLHFSPLLSRCKFKNLNFGKFKFTALRLNYPTPPPPQPLPPPELRELAHVACLRKDLIQRTILSAKDKKKIQL